MSEQIKISVLTSLYNCEAFLHGYFKALSELNGTERLEVLLLHNAPKESETAIINQYIPKMNYVRYIPIPEREGLYSTWNRGIDMAKGEYITVWNVDDVRFPDSILQQARALDEHPEAAISFGDIWVSKQYGVCGSVRTHCPTNNDRKDFFKAYYIVCFQMWRKSIHPVIGYYDEQFKCSADFDFQIRAAIHFPFVKTKEVLGIYLEDQPHKLSANKTQILENNIIYLRYGALSRLNIFKWYQSEKKYRKKQLKFFGKWTDFEPQSRFNRLEKLKGLCVALFGSSVWLLKQIVKRIINFS